MLGFRVDRSWIKFHGSTSHLREEGASVALALTVLCVPSDLDCLIHASTVLYVTYGLDCLMCANIGPHRRRRKLCVQPPRPSRQGRGNDLQDCNDFHLKASARIWP